MSTGGSILPNTNSSKFTPRRVRLATASHTALFGDAPQAANTVAAGRLGGGIGINGSTATSRALLGGDSAKGVGIGQQWSLRSGGAAVGFHNQLGRSDADSSTRAPAGVAYRQRKLGNSASKGVLATAPQTWRFLKDGVTMSDGSALHSMQPLPQPVPLTPAAREYLAQYERAQAIHTPAGADTSQTFTALLSAQHRSRQDAEELHRLRLQHQAFQHAFGLVDFEQFVERKEEFAEWARRKEAKEEEMNMPYSNSTQQQQQNKRNEEEGKELEERHAAHQQQQQTDAQVAAAIAERLSLKNNFVPSIVSVSSTSPPLHTAAANKRASTGIAGAGAGAGEMKSSRAEFMAQLERMDEGAHSLRSSLHSTRTHTPSAPLQARDPSEPRSSRPLSTRSNRSTGGGGRTREEREREERERKGNGGGEDDDEHTDGETVGEIEVPLAPTTNSPENEEQFQASLTTHAMTAALIREMEEEERVKQEHSGSSDTAHQRAVGEKPSQSSSRRSSLHRDPHPPASIAAAVAAESRQSHRSDARSHGEHEEERDRQPSQSRRSRARTRAEKDDESKTASNPAASSSGGLKASDLPLSPRSPHSRSSSRSTSRGSSPVILWRATNRVKEALDIPNELRSVFLKEDDQEEEEEERDGEEEESFSPILSSRKSTSHYAPHSLSTLERIALTRSNDFDAASSAMQELELNLNPRYQAARQRAKRERFQQARIHMQQGGSTATVQALLARKPAPPESSFTYRKHQPRIPKKYGAWYLPTSLWIAEDAPHASPGVYRSTLSRRVDTSLARMSLGVWGAGGKSKHGREQIMVGQMEYEEARTKMGLNGLASWEEIQRGARIGSSTLPGRAIQGQSRTQEEEEEIDVGDKINSIKAASLEARARRRRLASQSKIASYERSRAAKIAHSKAREMAAKGVWQKHAREQDEEAQNALAMTYGSTTDAAESPSSHHPKTSSLPTAGSAASLEEKLALLREQIPHLQISQEYKLYVQSLGQRIPHYLAGTDAMQAAQAEREWRESVGGLLMHQRWNTHAGGGEDGTAGSTVKHHTSGVPIASSSSSFEADSHTVFPPVPSTARVPATSRQVGAQGGLGQRVNLSGGAATERGDYRFR
jgi:hypothetical protein